MTKSVTVAIAQVVAQLAAFAGVVAGFWHILWFAGVGIIASGLAAALVHSAGYWRLEQERQAKPQGEEPK